MVRGTGNVCSYVASATDAAEEYRLSWRAANAPVFTLAYRGGEVDALRKRKREAVEASDESKTILFSHATRECYVAKHCIHLSEGDPQLLLQYIVERLEDGVVMSSLKVVDINVQTTDVQMTAGQRIETMRRIEDGWAKELYQQSLQNKSGARNFTDRRSMMWVGDANLKVVSDILSLQPVLHHLMGSVVVLTSDPLLQIHIPVADAENQLRAAAAAAANRCTRAQVPTFRFPHLCKL